MKKGLALLVVCLMAALAINCKPKEEQTETSVEEAAPAPAEQVAPAPAEAPAPVEQPAPTEAPAEHAE